MQRVMFVPWVFFLIGLILRLPASASASDLSSTVWYGHADSGIRTTRYLEIFSLDDLPGGGTAAVKAVYGSGAGVVAPVRGSIIQRNGVLQLTFATTRSGRLDLTISGGTATGSETTKDGVVRSIELTRIGGEASMTEEAGRAAVMLGQWAGQLKAEDTRNVLRSLDVKRLLRRPDGKFVAVAQYGDPVKAGDLQQVTAVIDDGGERPVMRFVTPARWKARITLTNQNQLSGKLTGPDGRVRPITFRRETNMVAPDPAPPSTATTAYLSSDFAIVTPEGKRVSLSDLRGRVVMVIGMTRGCPYCFVALDRVKYVQAQYSADIVSGLGVMWNGSSKEATQAVYQSTQPNFPFGSIEKGRIRGPHNPTIYILGRDGELRNILYMASHQTIRSKVEEALARKP